MSSVRGPLDIAAAGHPRARMRAASIAAAGIAVYATTTAVSAASAAATRSAHAVGLTAVAPRMATASEAYTFTTIDDPGDPTFNQLLGINDVGRVAGYYGSGADAKHPNKGYTFSAYTNGTLWSPENYPGSAQTQVTGLNDVGQQVGFWVNGAGDNSGFWVKKSKGQAGGNYVNVADPKVAGKTKTTQLLGVNNEGVAVGFYNDAKGNSHPFEYSTQSKTFTAITVSGATTAMATGINDNGQLAGTYTDSKGVTEGFFESGSSLQTIAVPKATSTSALGVNDSGQVVGVYVVGKSTMHGFVWHSGRFVSIDDSSGAGTTTINGINNLGDIVGFYTDSKGNTHGFEGAPTYPGYSKTVPGA